MLFSQLKDITHGALIKVSADRPITNLITDSRKAVVHEGSVFFAIGGSHHDGHDYISTLYKAGIRQFVIEKDFSFADFVDGNFLKVQSTVDALQKISAAHRAQFSIPVIGITGSNGKTIIKEWLYQLLSKEYTIAKNPGSYNSQIGVPLSVWQLQPYHTLGIFEAGISMPGEMERLEKVIKPTLGIFTNIGTAHNENFQGLNQKISEKLKLFQHVDTLICCADHPLIMEAAKRQKTSMLTWGFSENSDIKISKVKNGYNVSWKSKIIELTFPFTDQASVENALHCVVSMIAMGVDERSIKERILSLRAVPMRLELKEGINQCQVIDDTYNNDLGGLQISIDFLSNQSQKNNKTLILSDVFQSGLAEEELISQIALLVNQSGITKFIGVGPAISKYPHKFHIPSSFYSSTDIFLEAYQSEMFHHEIILVKGARVFQFEKIVARLQRKVHGTVMEVDLGALVYNLNYFKSKLNPKTKLMVMVKAFAYGSGSVEVANVLQYHQVDYLGVAYADEGVELRKNNIVLPIMVMNPSEEGFHSMMHYNLEPEMYGFKILGELISFLNGSACKIHLKIDTGMHRLGFQQEDVDDLIELLKSNQNLKVESIFTHLAGSDESEHDAFSKAQAQEFLKCTNRITQAIAYQPLLHALNTPGILRLPEFQMDMVRLGIGLYGVDPTIEKHPLKPVATLKTVVSQIRKVNEGESIGYGRKGRALNEMKIATIAIGYADGYSRAFSGGVGEVWINGKRAKVVGNVCMDMTMIDVTNIDVSEGDEVIIFGEQLPIHEVAASIHTIPYEILTNTSERVKRVFVAESI